MKWISIKEIIGTDERCWHSTGTRVYYTGHMHRNSPYETDDSCGNCDGAMCDSCEKVVVPPSWEFSVPVDILEDAIAKAAPELTHAEIAELVYDDLSSSVIHEGEKYMVEYPKGNWLKENHPEIIEKLQEKVFLVIVDTSVNISKNHSTIFGKYYRFDSKEEATEFFESTKKACLTWNSYLKDFGDEKNSYIIYDSTKNEKSIKEVTIHNYTRTYEDFIHMVWSADLHYNGHVYHYKYGRIDSTD